MNIFFNEETKTFVLETLNTSYAMQINNSGFLRHLYYGKKINAQDDLSSFIMGKGLVFSSNYPENTPSSESVGANPYEFSAFGSGDFRISACRLTKENGSSVTSLHYKSYEICDGKNQISNLPASFAEQNMAKTLIITCEDRFSGTEIILYYTIFADSDCIARSVKVINRTNQTIKIEKLQSLQLDFFHSNFDFIYNYGQWARERHVKRTKLQPGIQGFKNVRGSSGHQHTPAFVLASPNATENNGDVYGAILVYSGSYSVEIEVSEIGETRSLIGVNSELFSWELKANEEFHSPEALLIYSDKGLSDFSQKSHKFIVEHIIRSPWKHQKRPLLINNWEGTYFDFDDEKICNIAKAAAEVGIEMLVLDDGWFGHRNDDKSSLGDWFVNTDKIKNFRRMVQKINSYGLKFGLWFEPEMISIDSELYKQHPEWVLCVPDKPRTFWRNQLVLNMGRKEVVDYLFETMAKIISENNIEYIKWDMNRNLTEIFANNLPAERQGEAAHRFVMGVYELHERLITRFPNLLIEGCSGGGGRFDAGMLYYVPQIWCSDDSDAVERIAIQNGTSLFYPASTMGAHVSVCPNHQTGRSVSLDLRGAIALGGTFGYELDITQCSEEEKQKIREQVAMYHKFNDLVREGEFYRITENFGEDNVSSWAYVAEDGSEALAIITRKLSIPCSVQQTDFIQIPGLIDDALYEVNNEFKMHGSTLKNAGIATGKKLYGDATYAMYHVVKVNK